MHPSSQTKAWRKEQTCIFSSAAIAIKVRFRVDNQENSRNKNSHENLFKVLSWDISFLEENSKIVVVGQTLPMVNTLSEKCQCESVWGLGLTECKDAPETERAREAGTNQPAPNTHINKHKRTTCWQSYIDKLKVCHIQSIFFQP